MRTKQQEQLEHEERTWIFLLHDQAPPTNQRHVTPAVLAARSSGALGGDHTPHLPLLPSMSAASPMMYNSGSNGASASSSSSHPYASHSGPYVSASASPAYHGGYDAYGRPLSSSSSNSNSNNNGYPAADQYGYARGPEFMVKAPTQRALGSVISAHEKWQVQVPSQSQQSQSAFPPLRSILSKSDKMAYPPAPVVVGPMVMKSQHQLQVPVQQTPAPVAERRLKQQKKSSSSSSSSNGLLDLLPKKRRHEEIDEVYVAPALGEDGEDDDDLDENKLSKRNCFPKKCDFPMCKNSSRSRGFCYSHGGGRRCRMDGCNNGAVSRDLCKRHGGGRRCRINGCKSSSESGGLCYSHGGGRRCSLSWCSARAKKGGFCAVHIDNKNAEQPPAGEEVSATESSSSSASSGSSAPAPEQPLESKAAAVVPPNVVETLLSLAQVKNSSNSARSASSSFSSSAGSPTSPSLPELSTPRYSSIASILN